MNEVVEQVVKCTKDKSKTERDVFIKKMSVQIIQNLFNGKDIKEAFTEFKNEIRKTKIDELNELNKAFNTIDRILFK